MSPTPVARGVCPTGTASVLGLTTPDLAARHYQRHRPEQTLLYQIIVQHYPAFSSYLAEQGAALPGYVQREFEGYLKCGRLEYGFLRVRCKSCRAERLVAFSCKRRGFCPSCGARRMAESAALLIDEVLPEQPVRQWVLSFPFQLRFLFASRPVVMGQVLGIVYRVITTPLNRQRYNRLSMHYSSTIVILCRPAPIGLARSSARALISWPHRLMTWRITSRKIGKRQH